MSCWLRSWCAARPYWASCRSASLRCAFVGRLARLKVIVFVIVTSKTKNLPTSRGGQSHGYTRTQKVEIGIRTLQGRLKPVAPETVGVQPVSSAVPDALQLHSNMQGFVFSFANSEMIVGRF